MACLLALLRQMSDRHYQQLLQAFSTKDNLRVRPPSQSPSPRLVRAVVSCSIFIIVFYLHCCQRLTFCVWLHVNVWCRGGRVTLFMLLFGFDILIGGCATFWFSPWPSLSHCCSSPPSFLSQFSKHFFQLSEKRRAVIRPHAWYAVLKSQISKVKTDKLRCDD